MFNRLSSKIDTHSVSYLSKTEFGLGDNLTFQLRIAAYFNFILFVVFMNRLKSIKFVYSTYTRYHSNNKLEILLRYKVIKAPANV